MIVYLTNWIIVLRSTAGEISTRTNLKYESEIWDNFHNQNKHSFTAPFRIIIITLSSVDELLLDCLPRRANNKFQRWMEGGGEGEPSGGREGGVGKRGGRKGIYCSDGLHVHLSFTDAASELATRDNDDTSDSGIIPDYRSG